MSKGTCSVEGCPNPFKGKGYCNLHYQRLRKYGDPLGGGRMANEVQDPAERISESSIWMEDGCLLWIGSYGGGSATGGYGKLRHRGRRVYAHRYAYEAKHGPIPAGRSVNHICGNTLCVYWGHLELTSHQENLQYRVRGSDSGRKYKGRRGAHFHSPSGLWAARYKVGGRTVSLGYFKTEEGAALAASEGRRAEGFHREPEWEES